MQSRSGRSQNVSPPSTLPGDVIRPRVGTPRAVSQASISVSSPRRVGLPERRAIDPLSVTRSGSYV